MVAPAIPCSAAVTRTWAAAAAAMLPSATVMLARPLARAAPLRWVLAVGATVTFTVLTGNYFAQVLIIAMIFLIVCPITASMWLWFGASLKKFLKDPTHVRVFNVSMALLLMTSLIPVFIELYQQFADVLR